MAYDSDITRQRQQRRRNIQKQKQKRQHRFKRQALTVLIALAVIITAGAGTLLLINQFTGDKEPTPTSPTVSTPPVAGKPDTVIHLAFGGDVNVTDGTVAAGLTGENYDYTAVFRDIAPILAGADAATLNFEGNLCGAPYGSADTRAPQELANALGIAGVDFLQTANSCSINNGLMGLGSTISGIAQAGMQSLGTYSSSEAAAASKGFALYDIQGVKVAFVAFTKHVGNMALPAGSENCVNLLYTDYTSTYQEVNTEGITKILTDIQNEQPDITVALLHWGSEYNSQISKSQTKIVELMQENGVDAIIGTHSHYVQSVEFDKQAGTVVAYSLGDFLGDADKAGTNYSLILDLEITKNHITGESKITNLGYTPIYIATPNNDGVDRTQVMRIDAAMAHYEANGIGRVSAETYEAMKSAKGKIDSRITVS